MNKRKRAAGKKRGTAAILALLIVLLGGYGTASQDFRFPEQFEIGNVILNEIRSGGWIPGTGHSSAPDGISIYTDGALPEQSKDQLCVTALDVGQGLSILVSLNNHYMIYDGGGRSRSSYVVSYLEQHGITGLDYLFASHYDEDHISGLVGVLNTTNVTTAVTPDYTMDTKIYQSFRDMLAENGAAEVHPEVGDTFALDDAVIQVLGPESYDHDNKNDNSIVVRITYGDFSCIITGDAEDDAEEEILRSGYPVNSDVYVVGHHGSSSSSSQEFVQAVSPEYALISVGAGNKYGHPTERTLNTLAENHAAVYRTDESGEVTVCYKASAGDGGSGYVPMQ